MDPLKFKLMHKSAMVRLIDAQILTHADPLGIERGDSADLLRLIAFEIFLKLLHEVALGKKSGERRHRFRKMFDALPADMQSRIISVAGQRGPSALSSNLYGVLDDWTANYEKLRYPYEHYEGMTEAQYLEMGQDWVERGAPLEQATLRYHPEELSHMLYALQTMANAEAETLCGQEEAYPIVWA